MLLCTPPQPFIISFGQKIFNSEPQKLFYQISMIENIMLNSNNDEIAVQFKKYDGIKSKSNFFHCFFILIQCIPSSTQNISKDILATAQIPLACGYTLVSR